MKKLANQLRVIELLHGDGKGLQKEEKLLCKQLPCQRVVSVIGEEVDQVRDEVALVDESVLAHGIQRLVRPHQR